MDKGEHGEHDFYDGYYGTHCRNCDWFAPFGQAPWGVPTEDEDGSDGDEPPRLRWRKNLLLHRLYYNRYALFLRIVWRDFHGVRLDVRTAWGVARSCDEDWNEWRTARH